MKKLLLAACCLLLAADASAQTRDRLLPRASSSAAVAQTVGITDVTITYGRPAARGRVLFGTEGSGALEMYGRVWRLGANEATTITFSTDVSVEGQPLAAGTYGLFAVPGPETWTFVFNRNAGQWGAFSYADTLDVLRVDVAAAHGPNIEQLRFWFEDVTEQSARVMMGWGDVQAGFTVTTDTDALIVAAAEAQVPAAGDWQVPFRYASYALAKGLPAQKALAWAERAVSLQEAYATVALKARLQAATGAYAEALTTAGAAVRLGEAMDSKPRDLPALVEAMEEWRDKR